jgi:hypothetical protein
MSKDPHQMDAAVIEAARQKAADAYQTVRDGSAVIRQVGELRV